MLNKFLKKTRFESHQDFVENYQIDVPQNFNFGYDIVDAWAEIQPDKRALCWTNDKGEHRDLSFGELKLLSDKAAAFFIETGIGKGDMVMLILKRHRVLVYHHCTAQNRCNCHSGNPFTHC